MAEKSEEVEEISDDKFANDDLENAKNSRLTLFFHDLIEDRINYQLPSEEADDIEECIDYLVETLVAMVTTKVPWLPFSRLLKVGSMAEGTSIQVPDEFDYLVVLHVEDGGIEIERVCEERRGYVHVKVTDPRLTLQWGKWLDGKYLKSDFTRADTSIGSDYFDTLGNAFRIEVEEAIRRNFFELRCKTDTGTMRVDSKSIKKHGPAFMQRFIWRPVSRSETLTISVDLTPAFEMTLSPDVISVEDTYDASFFKKLKENGKYMLISCHQNATCEARQCFCLTFTETEVELVRSLCQNHKDCYKLLKYVFNSGDGYSFLPSYVFKTLILKHNCHCKESENVAVCFKRLVASCLHYLFTRTTCERMELSKIVRAIMPGEKFALNIPSIFFKEHSILDSKDYKFPCEQFLQEIEIMLQSIEDISCQKRSLDVDVENLVIVNRHDTSVKALIKSYPLPKVFLFKKNQQLTNCLECYQSYFDEDIL